MKIRWILRALAALALIALGVVGWVRVASEVHLRSFERPPAFNVPIPNDGEAIARGEHLVQTRGCGGCHGKQLEGDVFWGGAVAPNLAQYAREEDSAVFDAAVRHAIGRDGRALYSMPSYNFLRLRDEDLADIIAYLRTAPIVTKDLPRPRLPWKTRFDLARGADQAIPGFLHLVPPLRQTKNPDARIARGEYIAMTTCNECHGFSLRADVPWGGSDAPDLLIVTAYDEAAFTHLMRTGRALGDRELPMMSGVARGRFAHFSDEEVADLYAFLRDMGLRATTQRSE
jgi:mono/diheme cytochrome c family protein